MMKRFGVLCLLSLSYMSAYAICPICTIAVGMGVGLSHWLGIDDTITGLWIGGLTISLILWTIDWFNKKSIHFPGRNFITVVLYYFMVLFPLRQGHILGHPLNVLWGVDKLILGVLFGSVLFILSSVSYFYLKKHNHNRAYFPFQKVVMPVLPLVIFSVIFYIITRS